MLAKCTPGFCARRDSQNISPWDAEDFPSANLLIWTGKNCPKTLQEGSPLKRLLLSLTLLALIATPALADEPAAGSSEKINTGDTAWMLTSTGLVLLMVPGLAL